MRELGANSGESCHPFRVKPATFVVQKARLANHTLVAGYVHTGDNTPGVSIQHSNEEFLDEMRSADLVICKGQGNFETLNDYDRPIFFLLRAKCQIVADMLGGAKLGSLQVIPKNV